MKTYSVKLIARNVLIISTSLPFRCAMQLAQSAANDSGMDAVVELNHDEIIEEWTVNPA